MLYFFSKPPGQWLVMMLCCLVSHLNRCFLIFPVRFNVYIHILPVAVCAEAFPFPACERSSQLSHGTVSLQPRYDTAAVPLTVFLLAYLMIPWLSSGKCEFLSLRKSWLGLTKLPSGWLLSLYQACVYCHETPSPRLPFLNVLELWLCFIQCMDP